MSNQDYDLLAKAAFDETDPQEDRLIEEWLAQDAEAQQLHSQMASLKLGLRSLADVPECQLSSDRLREAILSQGVKARPAKTAWFKWAAPGLVAACAAVVAFSTGIIPNPATPAKTESAPVAANNASKPIASEPTIDSMVALENSPTIRNQATNLLDRAMSLNDVAKSTATVVDSAPAPPVRRTRPRNNNPISTPTMTVANQESASRSPMADSAATSLEGSDPSRMTMSAPAPGAFDTSMAKAIAAPEVKEEPIVVLGTVQPETRARGAIEVQNNDVVFGG